MRFKSDRQRKAVMANITRDPSSSPKQNFFGSGSMRISKLPSVKVLSLSDFYDAYSLRKNTIIPAKGFYDHDKHVLYLNLDSVSKSNLVHVVAHELGHHFFGKNEVHAENFAKSRFGQNLANEFIKRNKLRKKLAV